MKDELRRQAEERLANEKPETGVVSSPEQTQKTLHELQVHQIELEMQNEELRQAHDELEALRKRYFELYDLAPVGYMTLSEQGLILEANLTASTPHHFPRRQPTGPRRGNPMLKFRATQPLNPFILYLHIPPLPGQRSPQSSRVRRQGQHAEQEEHQEQDSGDSE